MTEARNTTPETVAETDLDTARKRAEKRVEDIKGFYIHLGVYLTVNAMLFLIDLVASQDSVWFYWPLLGWGIGVAIHAFVLVTEDGLLGRRWEERKIAEYMEREAKVH